MAELQLKIQYKTPWSRFLFTMMILLFPLWAIVGPAALGVMISSIILHPQQVPLEFAISLSIGIVGFTLSSILLTALAEDNCIYVSKDGIAFPTFCLPMLKFRRNHSWAELRTAHVVARELSGDVKGKLFLSFAEGASLPLNLARMKPKDLEQFLLAVELWGSNCKRSPELVDFQKAAQKTSGDAGHSGYTQMWEDELRRRFSTTAFMPLEPEHILRQGKLKIVRQLAFGGLSAIYLAQQNGLDLVVLKEAVVPPGADAVAREQAEQILSREAKTLSQLKHNNIARVMDHFVEDGRHYLILEYINGPDLRQYVKENGALSQIETVKWAIKIADILNYLHSQNPPIIHRDLTPDNIVLCKNDLYLIDFGAANQFVGAATGTVVGKQAYIPPEQLRGRSVLQSDLYAFGGTLFYLLTGKDPLALAESSPKEMLSTIDDRLDQIVRHSTAYEIDDRIQSAELLIQELTDCLSHLENNANLTNNVPGGK